MEVILNIGQNNNRLSHNQVVGTIKQWFGVNQIEDFEKTATYKGEKEPTTVIKLNTDNSITYIVRLLEELCKATTQKCIAFKSKDYKMLVYNPAYKGEILNFEENLFIE